MAESLQQYQQRIGEFVPFSMHLNEWGEFVTNPGLTSKVEGHTLVPFAGDTMVFLLDDMVQEKLSMLQEALYRDFGWMLAEMLQPSTFHVTLHDLENGKPSEELQYRTVQTGQRAKEVLQRVKEQYIRPIYMRTTKLMNMVGSSVVMVLEAAEEESHDQLMALYESFEGVKPLNRALTAHITLGYFRPGVYGWEEAQNLQKFFDWTGENPFDVVLDMGKLVHQEFSDMNHYYEV